MSLTLPSGPAEASPKETTTGFRPWLPAAAGILGRVMIALLFWWSAFLDILPTWPDTVDYVASRGIPLPVESAIGALAIEIGGPVLLFLPGLEVAGALLLAGYCLATAGLFHTFWLFQGEQRADQLVHFLKNVALAGALLKGIGRP